MQKNELDYVMRPIEELRAYKNNPRTHSAEQVKQIVESIERFGFINPVIVDGSGQVIAGHGRLLAASKLGLKEVPVVIAEHLTEDEKRAYVIADNQLGLNSDWDYTILNSELQALEQANFELDLLGLDAKIIESSVEVVEGSVDPYEEWEGMPDYEPDPRKPAQTIIVHIKTDDDIARFKELMEQEFTDKTKSIWFPEMKPRDLKSQAYSDDESDGEQDG